MFMRKQQRLKCITVTVCKHPSQFAHGLPGSFETSSARVHFFCLISKHLKTCLTAYI